MVLAAKRVPELLEAHGGVEFAACGQQRHHLAKRVHRAAVRTCRRQRRADHGAEARRIRLPIDHEGGQRVFGVEHGQAPRIPAGAAVRVAEAGQAPAQFAHMRGRGDQDAGAAGAQGRVDEIGGLVEQSGIAGIEVNGRRRSAGAKLRRIVVAGQHIGLQGYWQGR